MASLTTTRLKYVNSLAHCRADLLSLSELGYCAYPDVEGDDEAYLTPRTGPPRWSWKGIMQQTGFAAWEKHMRRSTLHFV